MLCPAATGRQPWLSLFDGNAEHLDLTSGCWLLRGKLRKKLQPSEQEVEDMWAAQPPHREKLEMYGKPVELPRLVQLYSAEPLTVRVLAGKEIHAQPLSKETPGYLRRVLAGMPAEASYNSVLSNWYPSGNDYIGWHGDREKQIDSDTAPIVSISLGAPRRFQVRHEASRRLVFDHLLEDGECVVMGGAGFQQTYKHRVPKMVAKKDSDVKRRLNLTVRKYRPLADLRGAPRRLDGSRGGRGASESPPLCDLR